MVVPAVMEVVVAVVRVVAVVAVVVAVVVELAEVVVSVRAVLNKRWHSATPACRPTLPPSLPSPPWRIQLPVLLEPFLKRVKKAKREKAMRARVIGRGVLGIPL